MVAINSVSSVVPAHTVGIDEMSAFVCGLAPAAARERLHRLLKRSGNRTRHIVLPLERLATLGGATERSGLYRRHATALAEDAVARLAEVDALRPATISTIVLVSGTGWCAPSIDTHLVRRFRLDARCRRLSLTQLGCGGGVAALSMAARFVARDPAERVLLVSVETPSLQIQLEEPSYVECLAALQFGDGAAAVIVSSDEQGPEVAGSDSVLLPEVEEGGRIAMSETGIRLSASAGLPSLIRSRVQPLVERFLQMHGVERSALQFVLAHPRSCEVLEAIQDGLRLDASLTTASRRAWEEGANMVSASVYRAFANLVAERSASPSALGMLIAFGTGIACEMALLRWRSEPIVVYS